MSGFEVEELPVPAALDGSPAARDFEASVDARNAAEIAGFGTDDMAYPASELLPGWQSTHEPKRLFGVRVDGRIVARGGYETRPAGTDGADTAWLQIHVHPAWTRRGIGRAIADRLEDLARAERKRVLHTYANSPPGPGRRLEPPTGFGSVPADNREVRFLVARGWELAQVVRVSRLALPADAAALAERRRDAEAAAEGYRVHSWVDRAPRSWLEDMAMLATRMSTDAPSGGLDEPLDEWTVERWLAGEDDAIAAGRRGLVTVAEHIATGRLAGYTELEVPDDASRPVDQGDTIVLTEHRGHRLGMLLKIANIQLLEERFPGRRSIVTFNAEENRPMLDVNEAVGFTPFAYEGAWQKRL